MIDELKTDYKDDVLATSQQGKRTFNIVGKNGEILFEDVHIEDTSRYLQVGDEYGQSIINEQNSAINQLSKGTGYVFDTYAEYLEAYQGGEIPVGAIVYIKEGSVDGTITALQVKYNDSNVKLALDTLGNRVTQLNNDLTNKADKNELPKHISTAVTLNPSNISSGVTISSLYETTEGKVVALSMDFTTNVDKSMLSTLFTLTDAVSVPTTYYIFLLANAATGASVIFNINSNGNVKNSTQLPAGRYIGTVVYVIN